MADHTRDIGRFTNATLIGRGGFGSVYQANDPEHGREVAIKVLQGTLGETERRRFDRERQTMGRLGAHPNIVPVHESGYTDQGEGYIVMSLATKGSVADRLERDGTVPWTDAVSIIVAIAHAAQAAHEQGVLHRDIKPDNILIDAYDNPRLTDFGIAAVASNATATTSTTATIAHAAPEVLHGLPPTASVDIYALGSTFYNLILGRPPFQEPGDHGVPAMITRALTHPPPDLRQRGVPATVAEIAERAVAKEASGRQATAAQLADELDAALARAPTGGSVPHAGPGGLPTVVSQRPNTSPLNPPPVTPPPVTPPPVNRPPAVSTPTAQPPPNQGPFDAQRTMVNPSPGPGPAPGAYGYPVSGGAPPTAGSPPAGGSEGRGSNRLLFLLVGAALAIVVAGGAVLALSGDDDQPEGSANTGTGLTGTNDSTAPTSTTEATTQATDQPTTDQTTTTSSASTTAGSEATTTSSSTTSTISTTVGDPDCPVPVVDSRTARFFVRICSDGQGQLSYVGQNRSTGDGITLPACNAGGEIFLATNEGFQYVVDAESGFLIVTDPDGDEIVFEPLQPPFDADTSVAFNACR